MKVFKHSYHLSHAMEIVWQLMVIIRTVFSQIIMSSKNNVGSLLNNLEPSERYNTNLTEALVNSCNVHRYISDHSVCYTVFERARSAVLCVE